ncbi:MAG: hypothetical protein WD847_08820 [Pirellulales bacterium]
MSLGQVFRETERERLEEFPALLVKSELLTKRDLKLAIQQLPHRPAGASESATELVKYLVDAGFLTAWQCGRLLRGMYRGFLFDGLKLVDHLGHGSKTSIYAAEQPIVRRRISVVIFAPAITADRAAVSLIEKRLRIISSLDHPAILGIHHAGWFEGNFYYTRPYVDGCNLMQFASASGPLPCALAAAIGLQIIWIADYMSKRGHFLSVKPESVLIDTNGRVRVGGTGLTRESVGGHKRGFEDSPPEWDASGLAAVLHLLVAGAEEGQAGDAGLTAILNTRDSDGLAELIRGLVPFEGSRTWTLDGARRVLTEAVRRPI